MVMNGHIKMSRKKLKRKLRKAKNLSTYSRGVEAKLPLKFPTLRVVSVRPDFETATKYGAYWTVRLLNQPAQAAGIEVIDLNKDDCTNERFDGSIKEYNPAMIGGCGHGSETVFTGQNHDVMLERGSAEDVELMKGRGGSFLSCNFGASADYWTNSGLKAFYGYNKTVYIPASNFPNHDAELFFRAYYSFDLTLLQGKTWGQAWSTSDAAWIKNIQQARSEERRVGKEC